MIDCPNVLFEGDFKIEKVQPTFQHAREIFETVDAQREFLGQWLEWVDYTKSPEDAFPHMYKSSLPDSKSYYITIDGKIVGSVSFVRGTTTHKYAEIGYWLSKDFNGRGIITRAVKEMEKMAFQQMGMNRVEIQVDVENIPSQGVPRRCGYQNEGVLRNRYVLRGESRDIIMYAKSKSEWEKENTNA